jgi:hypothetical protein
MQFLNWTVDNSGAWDYAADTRGYTYALIFDYEDRYWGALFGTALEPTVANRINLEWNPQREIAENYELDFHPPILRDHPTVIRVLAFTNFANMGDYHDSIDQFEENRSTMRTPNIDAHPYNTTLKYGFGLNMEQRLRRTSDCSCGRVGMKVNTNHGPIPKSIRRCPSAETSAETGGGGPRTNGVWCSSQTEYRAVIGNTWR